MKNSKNFYGLKDPYSKFQKLMLTMKIALLLLACGVVNALAIPNYSGALKFSTNYENSTVKEFGLSENNQQQRVTGRVIDKAKRDPLIGVNVVVQGSTIGAITDADGKYSINLISNDVTLDFTFIGYVKQSIQVKGQTTINVELESDLKFLDEVVVVGYGKSSKRNITGSVSTISEKEMNRGVYSSPAQMLQGKVPGLNITRSGDPTARPSITLRGPSTLRTGEAMEPFYVIDGVPGASIEAVASDDIVSIDVLRDASSTAIYGSRAANGVIMVSTRRAKTGQSYINYNGYMAVENVSNSIDMLSAGELRNYLATVNKVPTNDDGSSTNWQKEVTRTGISHNHNISFGGGSEQTTYGASINYLDNQGIIKTSSLDRLTARINVEQKALNNRVTVGLNLTNAITNKHVVRQEIFANMLKYLPTVGIYNPDGTYFENTQNSNYYNPVALLNNDIDDQKVINQLANATLKIVILPGLTYDANISLQNTEIQRNQYSKQASTMHLGANGYSVRSEFTDKRTLAENYLTFEKIFGQHNLKLLAGYSWQEDKLNDGFQAANSNFISDDLLYNNLSLGSSPDKVSNNDRFGTATIQTLRIVSFYSRLNYQFNNKYLLQATLRRDGSSAFGTNNQWGTFPSASIGWRIINEQFMQSIKFVSELKLRLGYGISGNSLGFDPMISRLKYGVTGVTYINGVQLQAVGVTQNENPDLKWESTAMTNLGLDFGFVDDRITGTIELYNKQTSDLIWYYPVSTTKYLYPNLWANVGKVSNKGIEFQVNVTPVKTSDFQWTSSFNISKNVNKVLSLSNDQFPTFTRIETGIIGGKGQSGNPTQVIKEGEPIGTFFLRKYAGRNNNGVSMFYLANGDTSKVVTVADFVECGSAQPKFMYGWNNTIQYKNIDVSFFFRGVYGNKILNGTLASLNDVNNASNNNIPKFSLGEPATDVNSFYYSDRYLESGSYFRLDNATLGYTLKLNKAGIKSARLYVTGNNLFILTKYKGIDPEISLGGIEPGIDNNNFYPKTRSFMMGVSVNF
jgi:TonB-linked SusC/RagA family outer membrane protein